MSKRMSKLPKSGRKDETRRHDNISETINKDIVRPLKTIDRVGKVVKIAGTIITVAISIYGLIPKTDKMPDLDNQRYEIMF